LYHQHGVPESVCTGRLFWIWGVYAATMAWLWNGLTAGGVPPAIVWILAGFIGAALLSVTREI